MITTLYRQAPAIIKSCDQFRENSTEVCFSEGLRTVKLFLSFRRLLQKYTVITRDVPSSSTIRTSLNIINIICVQPLVTATLYIYFYNHICNVFSVTIMKKITLPGVCDQRMIRAHFIRVIQARFCTTTYYTALDTMQYREKWKILIFSFYI